jgi:GDPmannose 4,6-dehydratase
MQSAVIFGASGQDGHYLRELLDAQGVDCFCFSRSASGEERGDIADFAFVEAQIRRLKPDFAFHLAAVSRTAHEALFDNVAAIEQGTWNLLESVSRHRKSCRVFIAGSALQFENKGEPISEKAPFDAGSAYAASRIASVYCARYFRRLGLKIYIGYLFHHESPLRKPGHVAMKVALAARQAASTGSGTISIGDVSVRKEWTFAGDVVRAMWVLVNQDEVFEACIGSGVDHSIREWIEACFSGKGRDWRGHVLCESNFQSEYQRLVSDPSIMKNLGWAPTVGLADLAAMMVRGQPAAPLAGDRPECGSVEQRRSERHPTGDRIHGH